MSKHKPNSNPQYRVLTALAVIFSFGVMPACTGFFQNPTLTTLTVGPSTLNLSQGAQQQMFATATYNDGSTRSLTSGIVWTSSDTSVATVSSSGLVTGVSVGSSTITGEFGTVSGTASANVVLANVTAIMVMPTTATVTANGGTTVPFTAQATVAGGSTPVDVTSTVTWTITAVSGAGTTADFQVSGSGTDQITVTAESTATVGETATLNATYTSSSGTFSANATITVSGT